MVSQADYCLTRFAPHANLGWLWVEGGGPWGGLYEPGVGLHNAHRFWFQQVSAPLMETHLIYHRSGYGWVFDGTYQITTLVQESSNFVRLWPVTWPRAGVARLTDPNGHETAEGDFRVWEWEFFLRNRTIVSPKCRLFCNDNVDCTATLQQVCTDANLVVSPSSVCECFRSPEFYSALAAKLQAAIGLQDIPIDTRPQCLWAPCAQSTLQRSTHSGSCPSLAICSASALLEQHPGAAIIAGSVDVNAQCVFDSTGNYYKIENTNEKSQLDGLATGRGGNLGAYLKEHYGCDIDNPAWKITLLMILVAVVLAIVFATQATHA